MSNMSSSSTYNNKHNILRFFWCSVVLFSSSVVFSMSGTLSASVDAKISSGWVHSLALKSNGTVWSWGYNGYGQLGDETMTDKNKPVEVKKLKDVTAVAGGWLHTAALKSDGTVWSWGLNEFGQLGDGTNIESNTPIQITGLPNIFDVACGGHFTLALKSDGTVWTWGDNVNGQLGDGTNTKSNVPIQVNGISDIRAIAAGYSHVVVLKSDGTVWAWGLNSYGQLGDGTTVLSNTPIMVTGISDVVAIRCGGLFTVALKSDGTVWAWGYNLNGELGDGTNTNSSTPLQIGGLRDVISISGGKNHNFAQKSDGSVWAWGLNSSGQLGDGTNIDRNIPTEVTLADGLEDTNAIAGGLYHTITLKPNGKIMASGGNNFGQLGDGTNDNKNTYVEVDKLNLSITTTAAKIGTNMTVDGSLEESDWGIVNDVNKVVSGTTNNTVTFGVLWDTTYLYVGIEVLDNELFHDSNKESDDDSVEIYIDGNNEHDKNYDSNDRQFIKRWNDPALFEQNSNTTGVLHGWAAIPGGYSAEIAVPWSNLGITPATGMTIGFSVGCNDDDDGGNGEGQAVWAGTANNDKDTSAFGDVVLGEESIPTPTPSPTPIGLEAHYLFDEGSGTVLKDATEAHDGAISGAAWAAGKSGGALSFDGIDDYAEIPGLLGQPQNITISAWANLSAEDTSGAELISLGDYVGVRLDAASGAKGFYYDGTSWQSTNTGKFYAGTGWHHFVYVIDNTNTLQKVYVDGVQAGSSTYTQPILYTGFGQNTFIGRHGNGLNTDDFNGTIDDVCIYNRALDDQEVQDVYSNAYQMSYWKFDEGKGGNVKDSAGGNDGVVNEATWLTGMKGRALSFDGIDDCVEIPGLLGKSRNITISIWANLRVGDTSGAEAVSLGDYVGIRLDGNGNKGVMGFYYDGTTWHATTTGTFYAGAGWHHVVYVIDASNTSQNVYIDGVVMGSTAHTQSLSYVGLGSNTFIGKHGNGVGTYDFNGLIDDVSVYNRALSNQEVLDLFNNSN